jgi:hypothetical protein
MAYASFERALVRHHSALARVALGSGFCYGFVYTTRTGRSPMRELWRGTSVNDEDADATMVRAEARGVASVRAGVGTNG